MSSAHAVGSGLALVDARQDGDAAARQQVVAIATALADSPSTAAAIQSGKATEILQPVTEAVRSHTDIAFITIMSPDGTRFTHTDPQQIGGHYLGTVEPALRGETFTEVYTGTLGPSIRTIVPVRDDLRFRSYKTEIEPVANAVILYMMDVAGSMGDEQKEIVRIESFWIDTWLRRHYQGLESHYIIHDAVAREVDRETFFHTRESGGTMISSAYKLCKEMMDADYDAGSWNIYPFHFSDGDNWSADDTRTCVSLLKSEILPKVNQFAYGQVESPYGSGQFIKDLREAFDGIENVALSEISNKDAIYNSIKDFLGKGS